MSNQHIVDYLKYYVDPSTKPEHAVLISGKWGSGKTWFINRFVEQITQENDNIKVFQISLYGLNSLDDIASEYFRQAHPILSSRGMIIGKALGKALARGFLKLDFDGDKQTDVQVRLEEFGGVFSQEDIEEKKHLLVFDDVERCSIDMVELLGYINHFVEIQGYKAILLANEEKLKERCDNSESKVYGKYKEIREKLIGKVFSVTPDAEGAINSFVEGIACEEAKVICKKSLGDVINIYKASGYMNLRHVKRVLWNFEILIRSLNMEVLSNDNFNKHFLLLCLVYMVESNYNLSMSDLGPISMALYAMKHEESPEESLDDLKKYSAIVNAMDPLLSEAVWDNILSNEPINIGALEEAIANTRYFYSENTPAWRKLWNYYDLEDEQFEEAKIEVIKKFNDCEFEYPQILLHVSGLLMRLSDLKMLEKNREEIVEQTKRNVDKLLDRGLLYTETVFKSYWDCHGGHDSWDGLGYQCHDTKEFDEILRYYEEKKEIGKQQFLKDRSKELVMLMKSDSHQFFVFLVNNNYGARSYYDQPILRYVDSKEFVRNFSELQNIQKNDITSAISIRYEDSSARKLVEEVDWLKEVRDLMAEEAKKWKGKVSYLHFEQMLEQALVPSIETLEKLIAKQQSKEGEAN